MRKLRKAMVVLFAMAIVGGGMFSSSLGAELLSPVEEYVTTEENELLNAEEGAATDVQDGGELQPTMQIQATSALGGVGYSIQETFPDAVFAQIIADRVGSGDVNTVLTQGMINNITYLHLIDVEVSDATGIEKLTDMTYLYIKNAPMTYLNLEGASKLGEINISQTPLDDINLAGLNNLLHLQIISSNLKDIDLSPFTTLKTVHVSTTAQLENVNVSGLQELTLLNIQHTNVESLDVSGLSKLETIYAWDTPLKTFVSNGADSIKHVNFSNTELTNIDLTHLINLETFVAMNNKLSNINVTGLDKLKELVLNDNNITSIDLTGLSNLWNLQLNNNQLTSLPSNLIDISNLTNLQVGGNLLPSDYWKTIKLAFPGYINNSSIPQDQLTLLSTTYTINNASDFNNIDLSGITQLNSGRTLATTHNLVFENYVDENNVPVDIQDYIQGSKILKSGTVYAQVRATGDGLFPNTSNHAITTEKIALEFVKPVIQYTLSFDLNGATGTPPTSQILDEAALASEVTPPMRDEYVFTGWNTQADGSGNAWDFAQNQMPSNDVTLYAQWDKIEVDAIEVPKTPSETPKESPKETPNNVQNDGETSVVTSDAIQTSDHTNVLQLGMLFVLASGIIVYGVHKKRKKNN